MDYIELLKNIDYFSFITAFAKWVFIGLIVSILILIVGTKLNLFKRKTSLANILVKAYYILIPVYFVIFALKYAPIKNSQIEINKAIDNNKEIAVKFAYDFLTSIVSDSSLTQKSSVKGLVNNYLDKYVYAMNQLKDPKDVNFWERSFYKIKRKIEFSFLSSLIESKIIKETAGWIGIEEATGESLYRTDLYDLFKEGEIIEIFRLEINNIFKNIYYSMYILFGIGLSILPIEIFLSRLLKY